MSCMWKDKHDCAYCAVQFCDSRTDEFNMEKAISAVSVPAYRGPDEIDKWLEENFNIGPGRCASMEELKYHVARAVAEKLWWHSVDESLPPIDEEVIVLTDDVNGKIIPEAHRICFGHRPDPKGWDGKSLDNSEVKHYDVVTYNGWNIPGVTHWMPCPKLQEDKKNEYKAPESDIVNIESDPILASSYEENHACGESCVLWHTCRDRSRGMTYSDKKYR